MPVVREQHRTHTWDMVVRPDEVAHWRAVAADAVAALGGDAEATETARSVTSELLSNVLRHVPCGRSWLTVCQVGALVRIGVRDRSRAVPRVTVPHWSAECGRGLWVLSQQERTRDWGWTVGPEGKEVWFLLALTTHRP